MTFNKRHFVYASIAIIGLSVFAFVLLKTKILSSWFVVSEISIVNNQYTGNDLILKHAGIKKGSNIYALNLDSSVAEVMKLPYVKGISISRKLPHTVILRITERQPIASLWADNQWYLISDDGRVLPLTADIELGKVPVIGGIKNGTLDIGKKVSGKGLTKAWKFVSELYINHAMLYAYAAEIEFDSKEEIEVKMIRDYSRIILNSEEYEKDLLKLKLFFNNKMNRLSLLKESEYINLKFNDRIIVKKII